MFTSYTYLCIAIATTFALQVFWLVIQGGFHNRRLYSAQIGMCFTGLVLTATNVLALHADWAQENQTILANVIAASGTLGFGFYLRAVQVHLGIKSRFVTAMRHIALAIGVTWCIEAVATLLMGTSRFSYASSAPPTNAYFAAAGINPQVTPIGGVLLVTGGVVTLLGCAMIWRELSRTRRQELLLRVGIIVTGVTLANDISMAAPFGGLLLPMAFLGNFVETLRFTWLLQRQTATELEMLRERERLREHVDVLTGLPTLQSFLQRLGARLEDSKMPTGVVRIDIQRFRNLNDLLGHEAGDAILAEFGQRLQEVCGPGTVGRVGGDEFAILLPLTDRNLMHRAEVLQNEIRRSITVDGQNLVLDAHQGIALYPQDGQTPAELMEAADLALGAAKESGAEYIHRYRPALRRSRRLNFEWEQSLHRASQLGELEVHYQPIVTARGDVTGAEALLRWPSRSDEFASPARFVPVLESTGLIHEVGRWVFDRAVEDLNHWREQGLPDLCVSINVAAAQLASDALLDHVVGLIAEHKLEGCLRIEVTERSLAGDVEAVAGRLRRLRGIGVGVSVDDFGTGYSSLDLLRSLPVDTLKIDKSFILGMTGASDTAKLTQAILSMAQSIDLNVVAEGVETQQAADFLRAHGCQALQGYFFARALTRDAFTVWVKTRQRAQRGAVV